MKNTLETKWLKVFLVLVLLSSVSFAASLGFGPFPVSWHDISRALLAWTGLGSADGISPSTMTVVVDLRLMRTLVAWTAGAGLAMAGVVFQGILRNPLADPFTLGVSSGGAFGASLAIALGVAGGAGWLPSWAALPCFAMLGSLGALGAVIGLGRISGGLRRETLVLAGIVVATFLSALISLTKSINEESVSTIVFWIMGSLQGRGASHLAMLVPAMFLGGILVLIWSRELDFLSLGSQQARQLGVSARSARLGLLVGASLITGAIVSVSGIIGFVGLIVPHLVRMVQGAEHRPLLLNSALFGGVLLVWSDILARSILPGGAELPVGVVTALMGGPFFCLVLRRADRGRT